MGQVIREAGWPIYPILALGGAALVLSLKYAAFPQRSLRALVLGILGASLVMGVLGSILGLQHSIEGLHDLPPDERWIVFMGLRESLQCAVMSLTMALPTALALGAGSHRLGRRLEEIAVRSSAEP
jgi:hypothetical protein